MARKKAEPEINLPVANPVDAIQQAMKKAFKDNSFSAFSDLRKDMPTVWYPTGIVSADFMLGGGLAGGRMSEWFGPESAGKSTVSYSCIAATQQAFPDKVCVLVFL